jgi:hypothetical protein
MSVLLRRLRRSAAVALLAAACRDPAAPPGGSGGPIEPPPPAVVPDSLAIRVVPGGRAWVRSDVRDSLGLAPHVAVTFASADTAIARVDTMGQIAGVAAGRTVVTASVADGRTVRLAVAVRPVRYRDVQASVEGGGCALTDAGEALCWGYNVNGVLGVETVRSCGWQSPGRPWVCGSFPSDGPTFVRTRERFASLAVGWGIRCALTADGRAVCWGTPRDDGRLVEPCDTLPRGRCDFAPRPVAGGPRWTEVEAGGYHLAGTGCGRDAGGATWCWGNGWTGQAGAGGVGGVVAAPAPVRGAPPLRDLVVGNVLSCGLDAEDAVWCWGHRAYLGNDTAGVRLFDPQPEPQRAANGMRFAALSLFDGGCGLTRAGEAWCWEYGTVPRPAAPGLRLASVDAGGGAACGLTADGEGWCWRYGRPPQRVAPEVRLRTLSIADHEACGMGVDGIAYCIRFEAGPRETEPRVGAPRRLAGQG